MNGQDLLRFREKYPEFDDKDDDYCFELMLIKEEAQYE